MFIHPDSRKQPILRFRLSELKAPRNNIILEDESHGQLTQDLVLESALTQLSLTHSDRSEQNITFLINYSANGKFTPMNCMRFIIIRDIAVPIKTQRKSWSLHTLLLERNPLQPSGKTHFKLVSVSLPSEMKGRFISFPRPISDDELNFSGFWSPSTCACLENRLLKEGFWRMRNVHP